ncbi:MAG: nucleotidyltransferase family protein [Pseudomonadota bacterium]
METVLIVLAAGLSRRMGERDKLLESVAGKPLYQWALDAALLSEAGPVYLVHGKTEPPEASNVTNVHAQLAHLGQSHSISAGIQKVRDTNADAVLIMLGDMPLITPHIIKSLIDAARGKPGKIWRPAFDARPGHPVYWPRAYFGALKALEGDSGARDVLKAHRGEIALLPWHDDSVVFDVDTPQALEDASRRLNVL